MLREVFASNVAKIVAACVCPVVSVSVVALNVPRVRAAVHRATAPKTAPHRQGPTGPREHALQQVALVMADDGPLRPGLMCAQPIGFQDAPLEPVFSAPVSVPVTAPPVVERAYVASACSSVPGGALTIHFASVPEPATWAQMVAGFALLGAAFRSGQQRRARRDCHTRVTRPS